MNTGFPTRPDTTEAMGEGVMRSARLLRSLGPDSASIWAEMRPHEVKILAEAMDQLDDDQAEEDVAAQAFLAAQSDVNMPVSSGQSGLWGRLSALDAEALVGMFAAEHPQTLALILSNLNGDAAARLLRALPSVVSIDAMQRLLHLGGVHPAAYSSLEQKLEGMLGTLSGQGQRGGHERVARIFDRLDSKSEQMMLAALENAEPGAGEKVRALMFTFDDLATLGAGGMQTLLSQADRSALVIALKGAQEKTEIAFFSNMTKRAGDLLREEIAMLGPVRRSEVEGARQEIVALARALIHRGDIRAGQNDDDDDELVD